jgi:hypothetical protein
MSINATSIVYEIARLDARKSHGRWGLYRTPISDAGWFGVPRLLDKFRSKDEAITAARTLAGRTHEIDVLA